MQATSKTTASAGRQVRGFTSVRDYPTAANSQLREVAGHRDISRINSEDAVVNHRQLFLDDLGNRAQFKRAKTKLPDLLNELFDDYGLGWSDIAYAVGVSVSAVRKWRQDGRAGDNYLAVASLAALLDLLSESTVSDPAGFLLSPVMTGYTVRQIDLVRSHRADLVYDQVCHRTSASGALDEYEPDWRGTYARENDLITDDEGVRSLVRKAKQTP